MNFYPLHSEYEDDSSKHNIDVGFLIVCTGQYDIFLKPLVDSIEQYVLPNNKKHYNIFTDKNLVLEGRSHSIFKIPHKPFPYPTLYRFHFFDQYRDQIRGNQLIYIDADCLIQSKIGTEILTTMTVTQHCGFVGKAGSFESRRESRCYVDKNRAKNYYGGGFYSLARADFFRMMEMCKRIIDLDARRRITPVWHDESALNFYFNRNMPTRVLSPSYHYPENHQAIYNSWGGKDKFECKILLLDKNHKEIRS